MASKKLGDVALILILLFFLIGGISTFINNADKVTNVNSGIVKSTLSDVDNSLKAVEGLESDFTTKTDLEGTFNVDDENSQIEQRGSDSSGVLNILSKNVLIKFFTELINVFPDSAYVIGFFASIVGVTISILLLRFFWGDNKI